MKTNITTLNELATLINSNDDYNFPEVNAAIEANGWIDDQEQTWGVCHNDSEKVVIDENGQAIVVAIDGEYEVRVVSVNCDGSYDLQSCASYSNKADAIAAYNNARIGMETDKMLVDIEANVVLDASNDTLK